jgi:ABC-type multidrug transport system fused ATPase/permease subunit
VLRSVHMADHINSLPGKLLELVTESGDNFSAGQRQVTCSACSVIALLSLCLIMFLHKLSIILSFS